ncbi:unnamed protein product [Colias eurytheme]|nr:unnamed protein product [Colias eurytheme]
MQRFQPCNGKLAGPRRGPVSERRAFERFNLSSTDISQKLNPNITLKEKAWRARRRGYYKNHRSAADPLGGARRR